MNENFIHPKIVMKNRNHFLEKKLDFKVIENGTILPYKSVPTTSKNFWQRHRGGIVNNNGTFVKGSAIYETYTDKDYTPPRINSAQLRNRHLSWVLLSRLGACHHR